MAIWSWKGPHVLKVIVSFGSDSFDVEGDALTFAEVAPSLREWLLAVSGLSQKEIDDLARRLGAANTQLTTDVGAATPRS